MAIETNYAHDVQHTTLQDAGNLTWTEKLSVDCQRGKIS
jgi:hypothetical protein